MNNLATTSTDSQAITDPQSTALDDRFEHIEVRLQHSIERLQQIQAERDRIQLIMRSLGIEL